MPDQHLPVPVLLITGPVGAGKSSVAAALGQRLEEADAPHAVIEMDWLRRCYPPPADDRFHAELGLRNLAAVWQGYRAAGASRLVLTDVLEARSSLPAYLPAIPGAAFTVVRLHASLAELHTRLERRESPVSLPWYRQRAAELTEIMERERVEDLLVLTEGRPPLQIADEILERTGWTHHAA